MVQDVSPVHIGSIDAVVSLLPNLGFIFPFLTFTTDSGPWIPTSIVVVLVPYLTDLGPIQYLFEQDAPTGDDIVVYVVDTGVMATHSELMNEANVSRVIHSVGFGGFGSFMPGDPDGHGTRVAGIIAGNTCGVARFAKIVSVQVTGARIDDLIAAVQWIILDPPSRAGVARSSMSTIFCIYLQRQSR